MLLNNSPIINRNSTIITTTTTTTTTTTSAKIAPSRDLNPPTDHHHPQPAAIVALMTSIRAALDRTNTAIHDDIERHWNHHLGSPYACNLIHTYRTYIHESHPIRSDGFNPTSTAVFF
jgi:hypothetical protein